MAVKEGYDILKQPVGVDSGAHHNAQLPAVPLPGGQYAVAKLLPCVRSGPGLPAEADAGVCHPHSPRGTDKQRISQLVLQLEDLLGQCGLGDVQPLGGLGDAEAASDFEDI